MHIIESLIKNPVINQMPGLFAVLDLNSKFLFFNEETIKWTGFNCLESLVGLSYEDMPCKAAEEHDIFLQYDRIMLQNNASLKIMGYYRYADSWRLLLGERYLVRDETGSAIALAAQFKDITHSNIFSKLLDLGLITHKFQPMSKQPSYLLADNYPELLSKRQSQCLFYLMRGKTGKQIAQLLNLSPRTIEHYLDEIKIKLNCNSKSELIEQAIANEYINIIPKIFLEN